MGSYGSPETSWKWGGDDMPTGFETRKDGQKGTKQMEADIPVPLNIKPATACKNLPDIYQQLQLRVFLLMLLYLSVSQHVSAPT
jgi:hypothetical protein